MNDTLFASGCGYFNISEPLTSRPKHGGDKTLFMEEKIIPEQRHK